MGSHPMTLYLQNCNISKAKNSFSVEYHFEHKNDPEELNNRKECTAYIVMFRDDEFL